MNLCSSGYIEICYSTAYCPVCDLINDYDGEIASLNDTIKELRTELKEIK